MLKYTELSEYLTRTSSPSIQIAEFCMHIYMLLRKKKSGEKSLSAHDRILGTKKVT